MTEQTEKPMGWFRRTLKKYDDFIKTWGLDQPNCSCVPMQAKEDENGNLEKRDFSLKK